MGNLYSIQFAAQLEALKRKKLTDPAVEDSIKGLGPCQSEWGKSTKTYDL